MNFDIVRKRASRFARKTSKTKIMDDLKDLKI